MYQLIIIKEIFPSRLGTGSQNLHRTLDQEDSVEPGSQILSSVLQMLWSYDLLQTDLELPVYEIYKFGLLFMIIILT